MRLNSSRTRHALADDLRRSDRAVAEIERGVLAQLVQPVRVHGRALGSGAHDDEVSIPRLEPLETREELVALRPALRSPDSLVGVASGEIEGLDDRLLALLRLLPARVRGGEERRAGRRGIECVVAVHGARGRDEGLAALGGVGIEEPAGTVEPPGGGARERTDLVLAPVRRAGRDPLADRPFREPAEGDELATREDRRRERAELARDEDDDGVGRRLLEVLQQRVGRVRVHAVGVENQVDAAVGLERAHVEVVAQGADVVDADHLAERLEDVEVGMRARLDAALVAEQRGGEREGSRPLADPGRPVQEVRVSRAVGERRLEQPLRLGLLRNGREGLHTPPRRARRRGVCRRGRRSAPGSARASSR